MLAYFHNIYQMQNRSRSRSSSSGERERNNNDAAEPSKRLFVSGLSANATADEVRQHFEGCGGVSDLFFKAQENGSILCFVEMSTQSEADAAINALNGKRICGKMMWVKYSRPRPQQQGRKEGGGGGSRQSGEKQPFGQRPQRNEFGQKQDGGFKRFEGGHGNDRNNDGGRGGDNRGRFNNERQGDGGNNRGGFKNFEKREDDRGGRMFGGSGSTGGEGSRGGRDQGGNKALTVEEHDY